MPTPPDEQRSTSALVGREPELALLGELLDRCRTQGDALVLQGDAGIGKSTLANAAAERARDAGATVLTMSGTPSERDLPYSCLHQLLWPVIDDAGALPSALTAALGVGDGSPDPYRTGLAVLDLLGDVADRAPLVVVAEDAHWFDERSSEVLAFVARRIEDDPVAMVITSREELPSSLRGAGLALRRLEPLSDTDALALVRALAPGVDAAARAQILRQAQGNPLGLVELVGEARRGGAQPELPSWLPLTTRLERTFAARVADLPTATRTALLVAALADRIELAQVLEATGALTGAREDLQTLTPAVEAGLVMAIDLHVRFAHPLVQSAVAQTATAGARQAAHTALAAVLAADTGRALWHRVAATAAGTDDRLADDLATLAKTDIARGSMVTAARTLARAAQLTSTPADRASRLLDAAEVAMEIGRDDLVASTLVDVAPEAVTARDEPRRQWLERASRHRPPDVGWMQAYLDRVETLLAAADYERAGQALLTVASRAWWSHTDDTIRDRVLAATAALPAEAWAVQTLTRSLADPLVSGAQITDRLAAVDPEATPSTLLRQLCVSAVVVGAFERGSVLADTAARRLRARGRYGLLAPALAGQAWAGVFAGDWRLALAAAQDGELVSRETGQPLWVVSACAATAALNGLLGERDEALAAADLAVRQLPPGAADGMRALAELARGLTEASAGNWDRALAHLQLVEDPAQPWHREFVSRWALADLAETAVRAGAPAVVERAIDRYLSADWRSEHLEGSLAYARMLVADETDTGPAAAAAITACVQLPALRARAQLAEGARLRRLRVTATARTLLRAARDTFAALGMTPLAERTRQELRAAGEAVRTAADPAAVLSPQELQISRMAAEGLSNREIGAALYLSHRTVGSHLYRIFPKLGISSRAELQAVLSTS